MQQWTTACPDWRDRIREGRSLMPCGAIFPEQGRAGLELFNSLFAVGIPNPDGTVDDLGRPVPPTYGQVCRPWITEIAEAIHGAYNVETGERLIREALIKVPKKNWKSGIAAGRDALARGAELAPVQRRRGHRADEGDGGQRVQADAGRHPGGP